MWDVDYLSERPDLSDVLIYLYRPKSGVLRHHMRRALKEAAAIKTYELAICKPEEAPYAATGASSVFPNDPFTLCEIEPRAKIEAVIKTTLLNILARGKGNRFALFLPENSALTKHRLWPSVARSCVIVEERAINYDNLLPALQFLENTTALASNLNLSSQQEFIESFHDLLQLDTEMLDLVREFDERVIIYTDLETRVFNFDFFRKDVQEAKSLTKLKGSLISFLRQRDGRSLITFVSLADKFYWEDFWTSVRLVGRIYSLSYRSLREIGNRRLVEQLSANEDMLDRVVLWSALGLAWEDRLLHVPADAAYGYRRSSDLSITKLDHFGRDYIVRSGQLADADHLAELWSHLTHTIGRVGLSELEIYVESRRLHADLSESDLLARLREWEGVASERTKLVLQLSRTLKTSPDKPWANWTVRLRGLLEQAEVRQQNSDGDVEI